MRDDDHPNAKVSHDFGQQVVQPLAVCEVQVAGRLIRQDDTGRCRQRAGDRCPLLLAAAQLTGPVVQSPAKPHAFQKRRRSRFRYGWTLTRDAKWHCNVFERGELPQKVVKLEHETDAAVSHGRKLLIRTIGQKTIRQQHVTGGRTVQSAQYVQKSALPRATFPDYRKHLARLDAQIHSTQNIQCNTVAADVPLGHAATFQNRCHSDRIASTGYSLAA